MLHASTSTLGIEYPEAQGIQSPKAEIALKQLGFLEALEGFKFIYTLYFTKCDTAKVLFYSVPTIYYC